MVSDLVNCQGFFIFSCLSSATVANYKLDSSPTSETYYYAKRGCAGVPEDGRSSGDQKVADKLVLYVNPTFII